MAKNKFGLFNGISAYIIWGLLPIYWRFLEHYEADIVFSHRIIWSFVFMVLLLSFTKQITPFFKECRKIFNDRRLMWTIIAIAILISLNWLVFIWAVQNEFVLQASLGYYINPLVNVLLGVIVLREKLSRAQTIACILALIGVSFLTFYYGVFPWISLTLALTFGLYGLLKKMADIHSMYSLAIETFLILPFVVIYLFFTPHPVFTLQSELIGQNILLILTGVATAVPLLLFGSAVRYLSYTAIGFLQYIAPTLMLFIGVFLYQELFTYAHAITFSLIWAALIIYMASSYRLSKKLSNQIGNS